MAKIVGITNEPGKYIFQCPGCGCTHWFNVDTSKSPCWTWNGDVDKPTIRASILVDYGQKKPKQVCHMFVTDGKIEYLNDSYHELKGQTVDMPEW